MPKRCGDPMCEKLIKRDVEPYPYDGKFFCDDICASSYASQSAVFSEAADPFHRPIDRRSDRPPRRMNGG